MPELRDFTTKPRLPERTVELCLAGDLLAEFEDAERKLTEAEEAADDFVNDHTRELAARVEQIRTEMREATFIFRLRGLPQQEWANLIADHPPRDKERGDQALGYNTVTFYPAVIRASVVEVRQHDGTVEPELNDEEWDQLLGSLTSKQYDTLFGTGWALNRHDVDVPFSRHASRISQVKEPA